MTSTPEPVVESPIKPVKRRNRAATMERILRATEQLFAEIGVDKTGINRVAERADVNKVLVYRYFGGWNGLVEAYVQRGLLISLFSERTLDQLLQANASLPIAQQWQVLVDRIIDELRQRPASRALLAWELENPQKELTIRLAALRDEALARMVVRLAPQCQKEATAIGALLWGGVVYLSLVMQHRRVITLDLSAEADWERVKQAASRLIVSVLTSTR